MTYVLLMLLLPVVTGQPVVPPVSSCPASCAVCSEDAVICQRLAHIIDAPDSTQALLLTEGSISAVQPASLSDLTNITVIGLSHNRISELSAEAFSTLAFLHTLLLDHNLLTSQALQGGALSNLSRLEVLALGHNLITMIQASWFFGTKTLRSLKLEGNHLTKLDSSSFPLRDLVYLESLDVSDNLIHDLDENSFRGLVSLKTLDISRNRLGSAPVEAFSYLNWLTNLNVDLNSWNCSCQLLELAAFLSAFMQQPDKALYNGRRMVCVRADNPAVTTVLELTDANCVPSNHNITIQVQNKGSVTPHVYARDLAIAAVVCFIGGVAITLLVVLILYQVSQKKQQKEIQRLEAESEESQAVANHHIRHFSISDGRPYGFLEANGNNQQQLKDASTFDARTHMWSGAEENSSYYSEFRPHAMRRENRMNGGIETQEARERRKLKMLMEEKRRVTQHGVFNTSNRTGTVQGAEHENMHCDCRHRTYGPLERNVRQGRHDGFSSRRRPSGEGNHVDMMKNAGFRRETRKVTFDPESLRLLEQRSSWDEERHGRRRRTTMSRDKERRHKAQSGRLHKVKLHLNPQRKSKIHPRKKSEHLDESGTRTNREKDGHGGDARERKRQKLEKSSKSERSKVEESTEDVKNGKSVLKGKKTTSKEKQENKERTEDAEGKSEEAKRHDSPASDGTNAADVTEQPPNLQDVQSQGTGSSSQPPVTLSNADTTCTPSGAPAAPAGSQFSSSSSSLQGGNAALNTLNLAANAMPTSGPTVSPVSAANMGPRFALDNLGTQAAVGPTYNVSSLLASTQHASSLQASAIHTVPPHSSQTTGFPLTLAAHAAGNATTFQSSPQSQLAPDGSPLASRMNPDPGQGYPAAVLGLPLMESAESMVTRDTLLVGDQGNPSDMTNLNTEPAPTLVNMSNNNSQRLMTHDPGVLPSDLGFGESLPAEGASAPVASARRASSSGGALLQQEYLSEEGGSSPRRKLRLVLPEKSPSRPPTALERKIR